MPVKVIRGRPDPLSMDVSVRAERSSRRPRLQPGPRASIEKSSRFDRTGVGRRVYTLPWLSVRECHPRQRRHGDRVPRRKFPRQARDDWSCFSPTMSSLCGPGREMTPRSSPTQAATLRSNAIRSRMIAVATQARHSRSQMPRQ